LVVSKFAQVGWFAPDMLSYVIGNRESQTLTWAGPRARAHTTSRPLPLARGGRLARRLGALVAVEAAGPGRGHRGGGGGGGGGGDEDRGGAGGGRKGRGRRQTRGTR